MAPSQQPDDYEFDVAVIGSGASGLGTVLQLSDKSKIAVLSKGSLFEGSTENAQGGIAAVLGDDDSVQSHIDDTLNAGAGLCDEEAVRFIVEGGRAEIEHLTELGVDFTMEKDGAFHLTREGGHSHRRVVHSADHTGKAVENTLADRVKAQKNVSVFEEFTAVDLICEDGEPRKCVGFYALDQKNGRVVTFRARVTVIATGGASKVYLYTSNPDSNSGDGIAMAWRAGCRIANMEFTQFHPTCLYHPRAKSFLVSEALRGEGAKLKLPDGSSFTEEFDERGDLAPRDIVARAIDHEMKRLGVDCVYLDISHKPANFVVSHFP